MQTEVAWIIIYRLGFVSAGVFVVTLGYFLLSRGLSHREGEVELRFGTLRATALKATSGAVFAVFGAAIIVTGSPLQPITIRTPSGETIAKAQDYDKRVSELATLQLAQSETLGRQIRELREGLQATKAIVVHRAKNDRIESQPAAKELRLSELRVTGIIRGGQTPVALVENDKGVAYILRPGDPIGDGRVAEIITDGVVFQHRSGEKTVLKVQVPQ